ncbi:MAG TPA: transglutaminaseTgpA domain-containing protein [Solirubrobacteraceae bacterium]|nr:transglutaminaseTgpA domain-containing protein [Solirubrobacteraceae bacterium]
MIGFIGLAGFGALQWAGMVAPATSDAQLGGVLAAALAGGLLAALARRRPPAHIRIGATLLATAIMLLVALIAAGVPARMFAPRGWDDLAGGIAQGLGAVSTVRTPYDGLDEWTRIVLVVGGCAVAGLAGLLAFTPRRGGALGFPAAAAVALGVLYTVPVMQHDIDLPWLAGLTFTLLLATFLWLERLQGRSAGLAVAVVAVAALAGFATAPALDRDRALLDYEEIAQSLSPSATTQYRWNHSYGPLDWPRDGREVLRVRAGQRSYWKAVNLAAFDGSRWVQDTGQDRDDLETEIFDPDWRQDIRVTMRALRTRQFITAGSTIDIVDSPRTATSVTPGVYESTGQPLRRGHAYRAIVYTPRPTTKQMRDAPADYPFTLPREYGVMKTAASVAGRAPKVVFPWWNEGRIPAVVGSGEDAREVLEQSQYGPVYALARRLRAGAQTPFEYIRAIERYLSRGFTYSETPPPGRTPLADFLLHDKIGYCQQFSGAMALMLRMGGVPARVASGFSPGSLDIERREYVVRDVDAHSWVEVYMAGIGWVTRDPTPPDSPARTQIADLAGGAQDSAVRFGGSERALGRSPDAGLADLPATASDTESGPSVGLVVGLVVGALVIVTALLLLVRRRRIGGASDAHPDAELAELVRALERSGRVPPAQLTLAALAERYAGTPAQDYVHVLADARYGYGAGRPTRAQRAALRRELGAGLGRRGRLRAWWALPPKVARRSTGDVSRPAAHSQPGVGGG